MSDDTTLSDLKEKFRLLLELREKKDSTKKAAEKASAEYREAQAILFQELQEAGIRGSMSFDFGGKLGEAKFGRRSTVFGRVIDKHTAIQSLKAEGLNEAIVQESIAEARLNELVRERLESKQEIPDGLDYYTRDIITVSRKKGQDEAFDV